MSQTTGAFLNRCPHGQSISCAHKWCGNENLGFRTRGVLKRRQTWKRFAADTRRRVLHVVFQWQVKSEQQPQKTCSVMNPAALRLNACDWVAVHEVSRVSNTRTGHCCISVAQSSALKPLELTFSVLLTVNNDHLRLNTYSYITCLQYSY